MLRRRQIETVPEPPLEDRQVTWLPDGPASGRTEPSQPLPPRDWGCFTITCHDPTRDTTGRP
jgi:hypothetical protein